MSARTCLQSCAQLVQFSSPAVHTPSPQYGDFCRFAVDDAALLVLTATPSEATPGGTGGVITVSSSVFCR